jgi:hypothetical protein
MVERDRLQRLGALVRAQRFARFGTVRAAEEAAGMERGPWKRVELGHPAKDVSYARVEKACDWPPGSIRGFLDGGPEPGAERPVEPAVDPDVQAILNLRSVSDRDRRVLLATLDALRTGGRSVERDHRDAASQ